MLRFILTRVSLVIPTFIGITLLAFFLIRLVPGDPIETMAGERGIDPARHADAAQGLRLRPAGAGAIRHLRLRGSCTATSATRSSPASRCCPSSRRCSRRRSSSRSARSSSPSSSASRPASSRRCGATRSSTTASWASSLTGYSMPIFWWGLLLILLFSVQLGWTPVSGRIVVQYYFEPVTGFMLIDSLLSDDKGAFASALSHLDPADDRARHRAARRHRPHDPLGDARGAGRGLRPHRPRQGAARRCG